jgi:DegV family protein with EDD domain
VEDRLSSRVRVVTDSTASFEDPDFVEDYDVTVVPLNIHFGDQVYREGIDIDAEEMLHRLKHTGDRPYISSPPASAFEQIYQELSQTTDQVCVLLSSQHLTKTYEHAQTARAGLLGRCDIAVIDSMTTSLGLGYLVQSVAEVSEKGATLEEVVRVARGVIPCLYSVYYVDTLGFIQRAGLIGETQTIMGTMLKIKPLLTIEDGKLIAMEKARTHSHAIDKMVEFAAEFTGIEKLGILQNTLRITDRTRMLQDRLALEFSRLQYPVVLYEPLLASLIGPDGMGIAILEGTDDES